MRIKINTGKRTPQMRILSAFMAFLIFSLTFTQLLGIVDLGVSITAYAADTETSTLSSIRVCLKSPDK